MPGTFSNGLLLAFFLWARMGLERILIKYTFIALLFLTLPSPGQDSIRDLANQTNQVEYFAEFYSYEGTFGLPTTTHTFARFVKTINGKVSQKVDISWLPKPEYMASSTRVPLFTSVPGKNHTLEETLLIAGKRKVINHGKFSIDESLFAGAVARKEFLESGKLPYKMLASANSDTGVNCIHAVLGAAQDFPTGLRSGKEATEAVIKYFTAKNLMTRLNEKTTLNTDSENLLQTDQRGLLPRNAKASSTSERAPLFPKLKNLFPSHR